MKEQEKELLKKYMKFVLDNEGITFLDRINEGWSMVKFTPKEIKMLKEIENKLK